MGWETYLQQYRAADRPPALYLRPTGMLSGATAAAAIANGSALPLGDSGLAFGFVELLWREPNTLDGQESLEQSPSPLMGEDLGGGDGAASILLVLVVPGLAETSPPPQPSPIKGEGLCSRDS